jgi:hypothetical protein
LLPHNGVYLKQASARNRSGAPIDSQHRRNEWAVVILVTVIVFIVCNFLLLRNNLEFKSPQLQQMRLWFALSIPSLLLTSIILHLGKGCLQRSCELLLIISVPCVPLLAFCIGYLCPSTAHNFSRDRQVEENYVENGALGSSAHSIIAKKEWGPFFYRCTHEAIDTYPFIGKEQNGKVFIRYKQDGLTVSRDLDEWLAGKPGTWK